MTAEMQTLEGTGASASIKPWIDLAKERGMADHRVFRDLLNAFDRMKERTITKQEYQAAMQAFIDACSAKETSETPHL